MNYTGDQIKTNKQPELTEAHIRFQELGKRFEDCLMRLTTVANKLSDESGNLQAENKQEPSPRMPGLVSDIYRDIDGLTRLVSLIEYQVKKLEAQI